MVEKKQKIRAEVVEKVLRKVKEDEAEKVFVSLADVPLRSKNDLVQVRSIKGTTGSFSVDVQDGTPFSVQLVDGDAYHTAGSGYEAKLVKGLPRFVWENIIDASKYWLVKA